MKILTKFELSMKTALSVVFATAVIAAALAAPLVRAGAQSEDSVVAILNARNPTQQLSQAEAAKMLLGQTAFWHGVVPVKAIVRPDGSTAAKTFYERVLKMTPAAFRKHWDEVQLAGRGVAPPAMGSIDDVAQAVARSPGAISFAMESEVWKLKNKGVKAVPVR